MHLGLGLATNLVDLRAQGLKLALIGLGLRLFGLSARDQRLDLGGSALLQLLSLLDVGRIGGLDLRERSLSGRRSLSDSLQIDG